MKINKIIIALMLLFAMDKINGEQINIPQEIKSITENYTQFKTEWLKLVDAKKEKFRPPALGFAFVGAVAIYGGVTGLIMEANSLEKFFTALGAAIWCAGAYAGWHYFTRARTEQRCICKFRPEFEACFENLDSAKTTMETLMKQQDVATPENLKLYCEIEAAWKKHFSQLNLCQKTE